jgi:DNA-binding Lrp family transcriptional regulator
MKQVDEKSQLVLSVLDRKDEWISTSSVVAEFGYTELVSDQDVRNRLRRLKELGLVEDTTVSENPNIADKKGWRSKNVEKYVREHGELKSHLIADKREEEILERIEEVEKQAQENQKQANQNASNIATLQSSLDSLRDHVKESVNEQVATIEERVDSIRGDIGTLTDRQIISERYVRAYLRLLRDHGKEVEPYLDEVQEAQQSEGRSTNSTTNSKPK